MVAALVGMAARRPRLVRVRSRPRPAAAPGAFVAGWLVFTARQPVPVGPGPHPAFNAALYTLDVLIPAPALGQASDFDPQGATLAVAAGLHILGWLLAITVIAAISRSFSRT